MVQHDTIQASASLLNGVLEHIAVTQSQRGSCCCFPVLGHPGVTFLLCINSFMCLNSFPSVIFRPGQLGQLLEDKVSTQSFVSSAAVTSFISLGIPGSGGGEGLHWVLLMCPCAIAPAGDSCMAWLCVTSFGLAGGTPAAAGIQIPCLG